jgi:hypothetical protein
LDNLRTTNIKIGDARFNISSDKRYLAQLRPGVMNAIVTSLKRTGGVDFFEPRMTKLFSTLVLPTDICLDVGAKTEGAVRRVKALLQPLADMPGQ